MNSRAPGTTTWQKSSISLEVKMKHGHPSKTLDLNFKLPGELQSAGENHLAKVIHFIGVWHFILIICSMWAMCHHISRDPRHEERWYGLACSITSPLQSRWPSPSPFKLEACIHLTPEHWGQPRGKSFQFQWWRPPCSTYIVLYIISYKYLHIYIES